MGTCKCNLEQMICELCKQENPVSCDHGKNGYCLLFGKQAEKDIK